MGGRGAIASSKSKYEVSTLYISSVTAIVMLSPVIYTKMAIAHALCHVTCTWGPARTKNLKTLTLICLFTIQLSGGYDDD